MISIEKYLFTNLEGPSTFVAVKLKRSMAKVLSSLRVSSLLGLAQILSWGGSFFLLGVLADPIVRDTGWSRQWVLGALSPGLLVSGCLAPAVGRYIGRGNGRRMLLYAGFVLGAGLIVLGVSPSLPVFLGGWCIIGVGMAMGLYDALFAVLGKTQGANARKSITTITIMSGFCTTLVWPLLGAMLAAWGWRGACFGYAALLWISIWVLYTFGLPDDERAGFVPSSPEKKTILPPDSRLVDLLAVNFTLAAVILTAVTVQLIQVLLAKGLSLHTAIGIGTLIGPSQVGVRLLDVVLPRKHPVWTTLFSCILTFLGLVLLEMGPAMASLAVIFYAVGNGMRSVLKGTLPLELFGPEHYPVVLGRLARPALIAQAATPLAGGYLMEHFGPAGLVGTLTALAFLNIGTTIGVRLRMRRLEPQPVAVV